MAALRRKRDDTVEARIREALRALRTILQFDDFEAELVEFREESGLAVLRVGGGCADCDMHAARLGQGIEGQGRFRGQRRQNGRQLWQPSFARGDGPMRPFARCMQDRRVGETGWKASAEGATAPETLRQKDLVADQIWKETVESPAARIRAPPHRSRRHPNAIHGPPKE